MVKRKVALVTGKVYHIFTRSIAGYQIFNNDNEYARMRESLRFYQVKKASLKFDRYIKKSLEERIGWVEEQPKLVQIVAYCLMPTHIHLLLKQVDDEGISTYMSKLLNSYGSYFNTKHGRKGPLWETRFKNALIKDDNQLLHLTRYLHLNPTTAYLVTRPEDWANSSYGEYLKTADAIDHICRFHDLLEVNPRTYKQFVEDNLDYQRDLAELKHLTLEC